MEKRDKDLRIKVTQSEKDRIEDYVNSRWEFEDVSKFVRYLVNREMEDD